MPSEGNAPSAETGHKVCATKITLNRNSSREKRDTLENAINGPLKSSTSSCQAGKSRRS